MSGINRKAFKNSTFQPIKNFLREPGPLKVHNRENFLGSDIEIFTFS